MSKKFIGKTVESYSSGPAIVLDFKDGYATVQFVKTGHIQEIHRVALYNGFFSDQGEKDRLKAEELVKKAEDRIARRYVPSVHGVGFIGHGDYTSTSPLYNIWQRMFRRCYSEAWHKDFPTYIGCTVGPKWHNFQHFCRDAVHLQGFDLWLREGADLDKDIKVSGNTVYGPETCIFTSHSNNQSFSASKPRISRKKK